MDTGKAVRLATVLRPDGRTFIGALDVLIPRGPLQGLRDPAATARLFVGAGVDALLMHEGLVDVCLPAFAGRAGLSIKLTTASWQSEDSTRRVQVTSVRRAVSLGASAVAANCFIGVPDDGELRAQVGRIADAYVEYGSPLIPLINPHPKDQFDAERVGYVCRVGAELGGDIVKSDYPGDPEAFALTVAMCPRPVIIEESPLPVTPEGTLRTVEGVLRAGGAGGMFANRLLDAPRPVALARAGAGLGPDGWGIEQGLQPPQPRERPVLKE